MLIFHRNQTTKNLKPVSIIIAAHNEEKNLPQLLNALKTQTHPDFEVIIVNDRSSDATIDILKKYAAELKFLQVISITETPSGISPKKYALSQGIQAANNDTLLFTDADCIPTSNEWMVTMTNSMNNKNQIVIGLSPLRTKNNLLGWLISFETFITSIRYLSFAKIGLPYMGVGRNLAYTKGLYLKNNGFKSHESILSGDDDLFIQGVANKNNTVIITSKKSTTTSPSKSSLNSWLKQKKRHLSTGKSYKFGISFILSLEIFSLFLLYVSTLTLGIFNYGFQTIMVAIILRTLLLFTTFTVLSIRFKQKNIWIVALPILEIIYLLYVVFVSILVICSKRVLWK